MQKNIRKILFDLKKKIITDYIVIDEWSIQFLESNFNRIIKTETNLICEIDVDKFHYCKNALMQYISILHSLLEEKYKCNLNIKIIPN